MRGQPWAPPVVCAAVVLAALFVSSPWGNTAFLDDFSFAWTAKSIAETGRLAFNGWSAPTVGIQAYWGALIVTLFGFSFEALRLSMFVWAAGCALLLYATGRLLALSPVLSCLGAWIFCLSPLAIPLEASFMTDIPSTFFVLAALYSSTRATVEAQRQKAIVWLAVSLLTGILGYSIRQTNILVLLPALFLPAWLRRDRPFRFWNVLLGLTAVCICVSMTLWFQAKPFRVSVDFAGGVHSALVHPQPALFAAFVLLFALILFCLPATIPFLRSANLRDWRFGLLTLGFVLAVFLLEHFWQHTYTLVPFGSIVTDRGILTEQAFIGGRPRVLPPYPLIVLTLVALAVVPYILSSAWRHLRAGKVSRIFEAWLAIQCLFGIPYFGAIVLGSSLLSPFDRYLLPIMPAVIFSALYLTAHDARRAFPWWLASPLLAMFAAFGIAATHDYFAQREASAEVALRLVQRGARRTEIIAGFDYDAVTEIESANRVLQQDRHDAGPLAKLDPFLEYCRSIEPHYAIAIHPLPGLKPAPVETQSAALWLPPFRATAQAFVLPPSALPQ